MVKGRLREVLLLLLLLLLLLIILLLLSSPPPSSLLLLLLLLLLSSSLLSPLYISYMYIYFTFLSVLCLFLSSCHFLRLLVSRLLH